MEPKLTSPRMTSRRRLLGCALALLVAAAAGSWPSSASAASYPNDPYYSREWHLRRVGAPEAWKTTKGKGIIIAVVDSGVDTRHPDLTKNVLPLQLNGITNAPTQTDSCPANPGEREHFCHGTFVSGVAAAVTNNRLGVAGVAPEAKVMAVQTGLYNQPGVNENAVSTGVMWAADHGAKVINLSLGGVISTIDPAVLYAEAKGALVVVSAGNSATPVCSDPGLNPAAICVGASDQFDRLAPFSNYGVKLDVVAPGTGIWSTCDAPGPFISFRYYCAADGTSFSAPIVSGIGALLMSMGADNVLAGAIIRATAKQLGAPPVYNTTYGFGRVDAAAAVNLCKQICHSTPLG